MDRDGARGKMEQERERQVVLEIEGETGSTRETGFTHLLCTLKDFIYLDI